MHINISECLPSQMCTSSLGYFNSEQWTERELHQLQLEDVMKEPLERLKKQRLNVRMTWACCMHA